MKVRCDHCGFEQTAPAGDKGHHHSFYEVTHPLTSEGRKREDFCSLTCLLQATRVQSGLADVATRA